MLLWQQPRPKGKWGTTHRHKVVTVQISVVVSSSYSKAASTLMSTVVRERQAYTLFTAGHSSMPVPGVLAVASRGSSVTMRLVGILVGVLVVLLHQRWVVPAVLWPRGQTVAIFPRPFIMVVLIGRHQAATFNRWKVCCCVVAVAVSLGLLERENTDSVQCFALLNIWNNSLAATCTVTW